MRLQHKGFHVMMFILFSMTFGSYIAQYALWWKSGRYTCPVWYMLDLKEISDSLVHSVFVIKYWVLSMKV